MIELVDGELCHIFKDGGRVSMGQFQRELLTIHLNELCPWVLVRFKTLQNDQRPAQLIVGYPFIPEQFHGP